MEKDNKSTKRKKSLTQENESNDGSNIYSYIAAFIVVIGSLLVAFQVLSWGKSLLLVIAGVIFVVLLGAFQLQNDRRIEEDNFMQLMILILKKIPPFNIFFR